MTRAAAERSGAYLVHGLARACHDAGYQQVVIDTKKIDAITTDLNVSLLAPLALTVTR
jgi:hypothetical protein